MSDRPQAIAEKQTKSQILAHIAEETDLTKKQVGAVLDSMAGLAARHLQNGASGEFTIPSMGVKLSRVIKPARPERPRNKSGYRRENYHSCKTGIRSRARYTVEGPERLGFLTFKCVSWGQFGTAPVFCWCFCLQGLRRPVEEIPEQGESGTLTLFRVELCREQVVARGGGSEIDDIIRDPGRIGFARRLHIVTMDEVKPFIVPDIVPQGMQRCLPYLVPAHVRYLVRVAAVIPGACREPEHFPRYQPKAVGSVVLPR